MRICIDCIACGSWMIEPLMGGGQLVDIAIVKPSLGAVNPGCPSVPWVDRAVKNLNSTKEQVEAYANDEKPKQATK